MLFLFGGIDMANVLITTGKILTMFITLPIITVLLIAILGGMYEERRNRK